MTYPQLFFSAAGRFSRSQYAFGLAMCLFLHLTGSTAHAFLSEDAPQQGYDGLVWLGGPLATVLSLYAVYLFVTVNIRRLHDLDRRGVLVLAALVTIVGLPMLVLVGLFKRGTVGPNAYGQDPVVCLVDIAGTFDADRPA